jgi:hypothetical protein
VKELGVGRVQVFGRDFRRQCPPAEGDDLAAGILDRKHDTVAEAVVRDRYVVENSQAASFHLRLLDALACQEFLERVAAVGRVAKAERLLRGRRQPAFAKIGAGLRSISALQPLLEETCRHLHDVGQAGALLLAPLRRLVARRHRHAGHVGDFLDGFGKAHPVEFGQELEMIARNAAAEAVVTAFFVLAMEARRFLAVERTAGPEIAPRGVRLPAIPRNARADDR